MTWELTLRGGAFDGCRGEDDETPDIMIVWGAPPEMWATPFSENPHIDLRTAEAYRLAEVFEDEGRATYEAGEDGPTPGLVDRAFVPAGVQWP